MVAFFTPPPFMKAKKATLTFVAATSGPTGTNSQNYTFVGHNIGTPAADRLVIVTVTGGDSNGGSASAFSGVTIGGVAATLHVAPSGGREPTGVFSLLVPTGTAADIVVTRSGVTGKFVIAVYTLTGYLSATPFSTDGINASGAVTSRSVTLNIPANGVAVYAMSKGAIDAPTISGGVVSDYVQSNPNYMFHGSKRTTTSLSGDIVTFTLPTSTYAGACGVSWQ